MTPLARLLTARIAVNGPVTVAEFMADCLLHPEHGFYTTRDPFGVDGHFTTSPEISQMFGELLGLALAQSWLDQGAPSPFILAELGPGRGTLMADVLRATKGVPGFHNAARVTLVEASPFLRDRQRAALGQYKPLWIDGVDALPEAPLYLIANEFFDALPIRQFQRDGNAWRERQVGLADGALCFGQSSATPRPQLAHRHDDTKTGDVVETCAPATVIVETIAARIKAHGGTALILDYGDWRSQGDTLQALRAHRSEDPLTNPGEADLTAHVDFEALANAAHGINHTRLTTQGVFLERLGITERAQVLAQNLTGAALDGHIVAHRRLTHPAEMGSLFKVIGLHPNGTAAPPGLES